MARGLNSPAWTRRLLWRWLCVLGCCLVNPLQAFYALHAAMSPLGCHRFVNNRGPPRARRHQHRLDMPAVTVPDDRAGGADPIASIECLDALVARAEIAKLSRQRSDMQGALQLLFHGSIFAIVACCRLPLYSPVMGMAVVSAFFFHGLHETVHQTAFRSRWINVLVAHFLGFLCLRPARHYWYYHLDHHRYTGNPQRDSELQPGSFLDLAIDRPAQYLLYLSGIPFWLDAASTLVSHAIGRCQEAYLRNQRACDEVKGEARAYLLAYGLLALFGARSPGMAWVLWHFWVCPALFAQPILRFYLLAEHRGRKLSTVVYENTRTTYTTWFLRRLAWCMPYHMEHHAWPSIPFYKLREANHLLLRAAQKAGGDGLLEQGEIHPELKGSSRLGYLGLNHRYWMRICSPLRRPKTTYTCIDVCIYAHTHVELVLFVILLYSSASS